PPLVCVSHRAVPPQSESAAGEARTGAPAPAATLEPGSAPAAAPAIEATTPPGGAASSHLPRHAAPPAELALTQDASLAEITGGGPLPSDAEVIAAITPDIAADLTGAG